MIDIRQRILSGVSWSSAFAATVLGLILFMALSMIGLAVAGESLAFGNISEVGWGSLIWLVICLAITGFFTGMIAVKAAPGLTTKRAGLLCGTLAGSLLLLVLTMFSYNVLAAALQATAGIAGGAAQVTGAAAQAGASQLGQLSTSDIQRAAQQLGLGQEYRALSGQLNRQQLEDEIAQASPDLSQPQVSATADVAVQVFERARQNVMQNVDNVGEIGSVVQEQWQMVRQELTGQQFVSGLQQQGLGPQQAREVAQVVEQRVNQLEQQAQQAIRTLEQQAEDITEVAGTAVANTALTWLVMAALLIGLAALAGALFNDERRIREELGDTPGYREQQHEALHH